MNLIIDIDSRYLSTELIVLKKIKTLPLTHPFGQKVTITCVFLNLFTCYLLKACSQFKWELGSESTLSFRTFMKFKLVQDHVDPAWLITKKIKKNIYEQKNIY